LLHAQDLSAVVSDEGFRIFFLCEGESSGRATVERQVLCMLHLIHVHSVVTAGHGAASVDVPSLLGVKIVPRGVITNGDQANGLVLLARFAYGALWTASFPPLSTDLDYDAQCFL
jgi:hypothetical protein